MGRNKCRISWIVSTIRGIWILQCVRSLDTDNPFICFPISCTFEFFLIWWYICIGLILNHEEDTLLHIRKHALARVCCLLCILSSPTTTIHSQQVKDRCNTVVLKVDGIGWDGWVLGIYGQLRVVRWRTSRFSKACRHSWILAKQQRGKVLIFAQISNKF